VFIGAVVFVLLCVVVLLRVPDGATTHSACCTHVIHITEQVPCHKPRHGDDER
jgi:hypothetical protein